MIGEVVIQEVGYLIQTAPPGRGNELAFQR
jgi:hypothetical protein